MELSPLIPAFWRIPSPKWRYLTGSLPVSPTLYFMSIDFSTLPSIINVVWPVCRLARKFAETVEICVMSRNWRGYASVSQWRTGLVSWPLYPLASPSCLWVESLDLGKVVAAFPAMIRDRKGLQDHIFAKLTQIIAKFWRFAPVFRAWSMGILHSLKIGEVMSRSEIRAMICVREIDVDSSIQAQGVDCT